MTEDFIFDREQERAALAERLGKRRPLLVHGPSGVGKTLLITSVLRDLTEIKEMATELRRTHPPSAPAVKKKPPMKR